MEFTITSCVWGHHIPMSLGQQRWGMSCFGLSVWGIQSEWLCVCSCCEDWYWHHCRSLKYSGIFWQPVLCLYIRVIQLCARSHAAGKCKLFYHNEAWISLVENTKDWSKKLQIWPIILQRVYSSVTLHHHWAIYPLPVDGLILIYEYHYGIRHSRLAK